MVEKFYFVGEGRKVPTKIISVTTVTKYLRKGCETYLAFVINKEKEEVYLESVLVVNKF